MSWAGKFLRVDLTAGTVKSEPLNMDWARQYIGSRGLATKYLVEEMDAKVVAESTCVGCKVCTISCPFGTINYVQETGKVQKCDLCGGEPACAEACPTGAITYIDANWTGIDKMKAWADKLGNQPAA